MGDKKKCDLEKIFGRYEPPAWLKKVGAFLRKHISVIRKAVFGVAALCVVLIAGRGVFRFVQSRIPVEMKLSFDIEPPDLDYDENTLYVEFTGSAAQLEDIGNEVTDAIEIKPAIVGTWQWVDEDMLRFTPSENWLLGTTYKIKFPKSMFAKHVSLDTYQANFTTTDFNLQIYDEPEFVIDDEDPNKKYIVFSLYSNFPMDAAGIEEKISFVPNINARNGTFENRKYKATVGFNDKHTIAYVASEVMGTPAKTIDVAVKIDKGITSSYGGTPAPAFNETVTIPGVSSFVRIDDVAVTLVKDAEEAYEQVLVINATAKVAVQDLADSLELWSLPKDKPAEPGRKAVTNVTWTNYSSDDITENVLKQSKKIAFTALPTENDYEKTQSFRFTAAPDSYVYVKIKEGAKFYGGYHLADNYERIRRVPAYPREITIMSDGDIISMRGSHQIPILTRGVTNVQFTVWRMKPDEVNHIVSQSNGDLKHFRFSNSWRFDQDNVSEKYTSEKAISSAAPQKPTYTSFDFSQYLESIPSKNLRNGLFLFKVEDKNGNGSDTRLIMVTDQGVIIKKGTDGASEIFVQSIATGNPVAGSRINIVALNGTVIASGVTASDGHVTLPKVSDYKDNSLRPTAVTATNGNDFAFMPYEFGNRRLDYSDFNVGGEYGAADPDKLHAYLFSDRGIYRPGDEMRLGLIVKAGSWSRNVGKLPFICVVTDPNGTEIGEKEFPLSNEGFDEIKFSTKAYSPTGLYTFSVYLKKVDSRGNERREFIGSETVKVEEFLPDILSITASFNPLPAAGWIHAGDVTGVVKLKNLFGTDAVGNTVKAEINLTPGYMSFNQYRGYQFSDPYLGKDSYTERLEDTTTDENGRAEFAIDTEKFAKASYRLTFTADGFEKESGRNVTASASLYVSPLDYLIGVKADGDLSYIRRGTTRVLNFIAVGPDLKQRAVDDVELVITENRYVSVLVREPNGVYKYQSVKKEFEVERKAISVGANGLAYTLPTDKDGDFVVTLTNKDGIEFNRTEYSIIGSQNLQRSLSRTAELELKAEKTDFRPGETAQIFIKAPYAGSGLIAIERDKVYTYKWFHSDGASSLQTITIPQGLEGNGYITVMYARDYNSSEIYMSPFCYAVLPFSVSMDNRTNTIELDVPQEAKPGTDYVIKYSSAKPGKIVLMAIDEGILQVAKYQTPAPLPFFFKKRALEVSTAQLLDLVLPEFNVLKRLGAAGGGEGYDMLSHNLNPFKRKQNAPVAYWSGIVDTDATTRSVTYHIPDYFNGSLRVMAVAVSQDAIGVARASTDVKDTYVIIPNAPTFAAPGDTFDVSVTVTNNDKGTGDKAAVTLTATTSPGLTIQGDASVKLTIPEGRDATAVFTVQANDKLGNADIVFTATAANSANGAAHSSKITSSLSVRPSMPYQVWLTTGMVRKGENKKDTVDVNRTLYDEYATRKIDLSYLPLALAKGLEFYLETYPYGCSEQVTSQAYPYLFPDLLKEAGKTKADAQEAIDNVVSILASRQRNNGSIGFWTYKSDSYAELDAYCALFLTDAREKGYYVPTAFMNRLLNALKTTAANSDVNVYARAFSIYVLTRNEMVTTSYIESLKKEMDKDDKMSVAGMFLAATYKLMKMDSEGAKLVARVKRGASRSDMKYRFEDDLFFQSAYLYLISRYYPEQLSTISGDLLEAIEREIVNCHYTTFSSAFTLMGIESYLEAVPTASTGKFTVTQNFAKGKADETLAPKGDRIFTANFAGDAQKLALQNNEKTDLFYQVTQGGYLHDIPKAEQKDNIEVYREFADANGKKITTAKLGDAVTVKVNIRSVKGGTHHNIAVVDMLPSGLEADIESIRGASGGWQPDYVDIREDRVVLYGSATDKVQTFTYKARAITNGTFVVPPLFAEAMYDQTTRALRPQESFTVKK